VPEKGKPHESAGRKAAGQMKHFLWAESCTEYIENYKLQEVL
jgi:hypothetical protein